MRFRLSYAFFCLFKIHMEMLDVSLHEQKLHLIFKQTMMYQRSDKEGNVNVLKPVTDQSGIL